MEFQRKKINNVTVLIEKRNLPIVSIINSVNFGSAFESEKTKGIAHFIEHLLFKGTKNRTQKEIAEQIEKRGGILNGFTSEEVTAFWCKMPSKHANTALNLLTDLTSNPLFDKKEMEKEKSVILEEIKRGYDIPQIYILNKIKSLLYKKPFGIPIIGTKENISRMRRETILKEFNSNYSNNIISIVGKTDDSVIEKLKKFNFKKTKKISSSFPVKINKSIIEKRKNLQQAHLCLAFHAPSLHDRLRYAAEIFNSIFGEGMSSKLFQEIREKLGLVYTINSMYEQGTNFGYLTIYAGTKREKISLVKKIILREIKNMQKINKKEIDETRERLIGEWALGREDSFNTALHLLEEEIGGNAGEFYQYEKRINSVKLQDVRKIAKLRAYSFAALTY